MFLSLHIGRCRTPKGATTKTVAGWWEFPPRPRSAGLAVWGACRIVSAENPAIRRRAVPSLMRLAAPRSPPHLGRSLRSTWHRQNLPVVLPVGAQRFPVRLGQRVEPTSSGVGHHVGGGVTSTTALRCATTATRVSASSGAGWAMWAGCPRSERVHNDEGPRNIFVFPDRCR